MAQADSTIAVSRPTRLGQSIFERRAWAYVLILLSMFDMSRTDERYCEGSSREGYAPSQSGDR